MHFIFIIDFFLTLPAILDRFFFHWATQSYIIFSVNDTCNAALEFD